MGPCRRRRQLWRHDSETEQQESERRPEETQVWTPHQRLRQRVLPLPAGQPDEMQLASDEQSRANGGVRIGEGSACKRDQRHGKA